MSSPNDIPLSAVQFYVTAPYPCSYLPQRMARSQVATPAHLITPHVYSKLVRNSFRRSGTYTYRPHCDTCQQCISTRVAVAGFQASRSQRRSWKQHHNLEASSHFLQDKAEYFELYCRYQQARHADGGMNDKDPESYRNFLLQSNVETMLIEFREDGVLRMVSIIDILDDGLSAVYTFYDTQDSRASFGTYNVLWQISLCQQLNLPYLYLGYWIKDSPKMAYKINFQPLQGLQNNQWQAIQLSMEAQS